MVFSSLIFTFIFLPVIVILYFLAKEEYRNYLLLIASLVFYAYGEPRFVFVMLVSIVVNYAFAVGMDVMQNRGRPVYKRSLLISDIVFNLSLLYIFKYLNYTVGVINTVFHTQLYFSPIPLPIGISFFTFQTLSYCIDVYNGKVKVQRNPLFVALYISFFPQLIAGPIVRYSTIEDQIVERRVTLQGFSDGFRRFLLGFSKKIILANHLAVISEEVWAMNLDHANPLMLWIGSISFSLQIFYDFSAYSDMAIGLGKLFGFSFEENFNYPYLSGSVTEFWRKWHISLGRWFRDYVYIPLGGSRVALPRHILNLFIVWLLTGLWHGANITFVVWGFWFFTMLCMEKFLIQPEKKGTVVSVFWRITTLLSINFGWVLFNSPGIKRAILYIKGMLGLSAGRISVDTEIMRMVREYGVFFLLGLFFCVPWGELLQKRLSTNTLAVGVKAILQPVIYGLLFLWAVSFEILGAHNPFIYYNF